MEIQVERGELPFELKEEKPKKSRARKPKAKEASTVNKLVEALKFVSIAQKKAGTIQQQFSAIVNNWIIANNGIITAATKVDENFSLCPHTFQLLDALNKSGKEMNMTQLSANSLSVKSEKFKALIPCCNFEELYLPAPDAYTIQVDNRLKLAFEAVAVLATEGAEVAHLAGVYLQNNSVVCTNNHAVLEYWHGLDLQGFYAIVPKAAAVAVAKCEKNLVKLGLAQSSVTFYFEDESFIKTQLYAEQYPNYQQWLNVESNPWPLPPEFFKAVKAVESFSKNGIVYFDNGVISSRESENEATTYKVEGLPNGMAFSAKYLSQLEHAMQQVYFDTSKPCAIFFGENIRGMLLGVTSNTPIEHIDRNEELPNDGIPF